MNKPNPHHNESSPAPETGKKEHEPLNQENMQCPRWSEAMRQARKELPDTHIQELIRQRAIEIMNHYY